MIEADGIPFAQTAHIGQLRTRQVRKKILAKNNKKNHFQRISTFFSFGILALSFGFLRSRNSHIRPQNTRTKFHNHFASISQSKQYPFVSFFPFDHDHSYLCLFDCQMYGRFCVEIRTRRSNFMQFAHQHGHLRLQLLCD